MILKILDSRLFKRFVDLCEPDYVYKSIYDINFEDELFRSRFEYLLFDIDNTIMRDNSYDISDTLLSYFARLRALNYKVCLVSNNKFERVQRVGNALHVFYVYDAKKPNAQAYLKALQILNADNVYNAIMIGDQLFTDIKGANSAGLHSILVDPISKQECFPVKIKRGFENIVRKHLNL